MKYTITLSDLTLQEYQQVNDLLVGKVETGKAPSKASVKKKIKEIIEEEEEEIADESEEEIEEETEDEPDFDADSEEEVDEEEEEVEAPKKKKTTAASAGKSATVTIETVIAAFQATKKVLIKKLKTEEKANAKLNALLKKHGSKSIKGIKPNLLATVLKEVKALAA